MIDREKCYERLLKIGPDHDTDVSVVYKAILADSEADKLETILPKLIVPYANADVDLDQPKNWVAVHAWRLLVRLNSGAGLMNMLTVADHPNDHLAYREFAASAAAAGPEAANILMPIIEDKTASDTRRILAVKGLVAVATDYVDLRDKVIFALGSLIEGSTDPVGDINGFAAEGLMMLKADCAKLVERAYLAGKIQVGLVRAASLGAYFGFES